MKRRKNNRPVLVTSKPGASGAGSSPITPKSGVDGAPSVPITSQWDVNGTQPLNPTPTTETRRHGEKQNRGRRKPGKAKPGKTKRRRTAGFSLKQRRADRFRALSFPEVEGKTTASVEMITTDDYHAVIIVFDDDTTVGFEFQPGFAIQAFAGDIEGVGPAAGRKWPEVQSERRE